MENTHSLSEASSPRHLTFIQISCFSLTLALALAASHSHSGETAIKGIAVGMIIPEIESTLGQDLYCEHMSFNVKYRCYPKENMNSEKTGIEPQW